MNPGALKTFRTSGRLSCDGRCRSQKGSALIAIVAALVVFSALTAALLPMISSSGEESAMALIAEKAYYLAESGYRYAVSRYRHPDPGLQASDILEELDQKSFTLDNGDSFRLAVFSYFLSTSTAVAAGQTSFNALAPGSFPADELDPGQFNGQKIQIDDAVYTISSASLDSDDELEITVDAPLESVAANTIVYPVVETSGAQSLSQGGNLDYPSGQGRMFPLRNGLIVVDGRPLIYRVNDRNAHRLEDVREPDPDGVPLTNLLVPGGSRIVLAANTRIESTGIAGDAESETRRKITFYSALGVQTPARKVAHQEDFSGPSSSFTGEGGVGGTSVDTVAGVLKVTRVDQGKVLALLNLRDDQAKEFRDAHRSSRGYINYDAQTKVGFAPEPNWASADFTIGLSFRLRPDGGGQAGYGLSFLKSKVGVGTFGIPGALVPPGSANERAIVLWQQPRAEANPVWLAYKKIFEQPAESSFDFENGDQGWSANRDWTHAQPGAGGSFAFHYSNNGLTFADASLKSPPITLDDEHPKISLAFRTKYENSQGGFDRIEKKVRILSYPDLKPIAYTDSNGRRVEIGKTITRVSSGGAWLEESVDLSRAPVRQIVVEFLFDVAVAFRQQTWSVDDVRIVYEWPINDSTLAVRLQEAAVIEFNQGGPHAIEMGDRLLGETSGISGTVSAPPIIDGGNWNAGNASGTILLIDLPPEGWFSGGENLLVVGKGRFARLKGAPDQASSRKVNVIKAYYAGREGDPDGDDIATNRITLPYPRLKAAERLKWPPAEGVPWSAGSDYLRLIQWDAVNPAVSGVAAIPAWDKAEERTVLRCYHSNLQSPPYNALFNAPELGLHAMGLPEIAQRAYFDDFGYRLTIGEGYSLPYSFQQ